MDVPDCQGCRELRQRVAELEAQLRELEARLKQHAGNSSLPPSANPPGAPKPVQKRPTGRAPGGQPGHPGHARVRLPRERVGQIVDYVPRSCNRCGGSLPQQAGPNDPEPSWHQVAELPPLRAEVTEHRGHARTCATCGRVTRATIPAEVWRYSFGPRLAAAVAYLTGRCHDSKRTVAEVVETLFDVPLALGSVTNLEQEMSTALVPAHAEAVAAVREAPVKYADETGWKETGRMCWLWLAATSKVAAYLIHASRGIAGLTDLLGDTIGGWLHSDRWGAYSIVPVRRRQICWAHLRRDFQKWLDRGGPGEEFGSRGRDLTDQLFAQWRAFRDQPRSRSWLRRRLRPVRRELQRLLLDHGRNPDAKVASFCRSLLKLEPALWTFTRVDGVEPTNNHAERQLRPAVLWRKNAFGCWSEAGCRFAERILTVVQTLRLQGRRSFDYLTQALSAYRAGLSPPQLLLGR
jgi:transposase